MCVPRAIVNLIQLSLIQCDVGGPVCVPRAIVNLIQPSLIQCDVGPVCTELLSTFNPVWCDVGPVCVPIELLSTHFILP